MRDEESAVLPQDDPLLVAMENDGICKPERFPGDLAHLRSFIAKLNEPKNARRFWTELMSPAEAEAVDRAIESVGPVRIHAGFSLPPDVVRLVVAARQVAFGDLDRSKIQELDAAAEAFASRVPWQDEPAEAARA